MDVMQEVDEFASNNLQIISADANKAKINWLKGVAPKFDRIAHFGCRQGDQTLSLAWILGAEEALGIDGDLSNIKAAQGLKPKFYRDIKNLNDSIRQEAKQRSGDRVSAFLIEFKTYFAGLFGESYEAMLNKFKGLKFPDFVMGDMTNQTDPKCSDLEQLQAGYYDLVFADQVLEHIAFTRRHRDDELAEAAIGEMVRVAKVGGTIVLITPLVFEFRDIFESFELEKIPISQDLDLFSNYNVYVYKKTA